MKFDRKPPLPNSPSRLRSSRVLRSNSASVQTPRAESATVGRVAEVKPEYKSISCQLRALSNKVHDGVENLHPATPKSKLSGGCYNSSLRFERGELYDEYSAMRNERLKMKKLGNGGGGGGNGAEDSAKTPYGTGVTATKKMDSSRKSAAASVHGSGQKLSGGDGPRYLLRSMCKESKNSKPTAIPLPPPSFERSERRFGVRRSARNIGLC
ncbi:hypothetical protein LINGRAHAP2_LOCUS35881 [Linum grandiflorum]